MGYSWRHAQLAGPGARDALSLTTGPAGSAIAGPVVDSDAAGGALQPRVLGQTALRAFAERLRAGGIDAWMNHREIDSGQDLIARINDGLRQVHCRIGFLLQERPTVVVGARAAGQARGLPRPPCRAFALGLVLPRPDRPATDGGERRQELPPVPLACPRAGGAAHYLRHNFAGYQFPLLVRTVPYAHRRRAACSGEPMGINAGDCHPCRRAPPRGRLRWPTGSTDRLVRAAGGSMHGNGIRGRFAAKLVGGSHKPLASGSKVAR